MPRFLRRTGRKAVVRAYRKAMPLRKTGVRFSKKRIFRQKRRSYGLKNTVTIVATREMIGRTTENRTVSLVVDQLEIADVLHRTYARSSAGDAKQLALLSVEVEAIPYYSSALYGKMHLARWETIPPADLANPAVVSLPALLEAPFTKSRMFGVPFSSKFNVAAYLKRKGLPVYAPRVQLATLQGCRQYLGADFPNYFYYSEIGSSQPMNEAQNLFGLYRLSLRFGLRSTTV